MNEPNLDEPCAHRRLRSAFASLQSNRRVFAQPRTLTFFTRTRKTRYTGFSSPNGTGTGTTEADVKEDIQNTLIGQSRRARLILICSICLKVLLSVIGYSFIIVIQKPFQGMQHFFTTSKDENNNDFHSLALAKTSF